MTINDVINIVRLRLLDSPVNFFVEMDSGIPAELIGDEVIEKDMLLFEYEKAAARPG